MIPRGRQANLLMAPRSIRTRPDRMRQPGIGRVRDWVVGTALLALVVTGVALTMPLPGSLVVPAHCFPLSAATYLLHEDTY